MSHRPRLRVFAFNAGFLRDHMNGAFLVLWPLLERGGLGAPGQPVSREPLRADQADLRCLGLDIEESQPGLASASPQGIGSVFTYKTGTKSAPLQKCSDNDDAQPAPQRGSRSRFHSSFPL